MKEDKIMLNEKLLSEDIASITKKANDYKAMGIITSRDLELIARVCHFLSQ